MAVAWNHFLGLNNKLLFFGSGADLKEQLPQAGWRVNITESNRLIRPPGLSEKGGVWFFLIALTIQQAYHMKGKGSGICLTGRSFLEAFIQSSLVIVRETWDGFSLPRGIHGAEGRYAWGQMFFLWYPLENGGGVSGSLGMSLVFPKTNTFEDQMVVSRVFNQDGYVCVSMIRFS